MNEGKKKKIILIIVILLTLVVIANRFVFSYAKYAYNYTREYFLKSKGFYFYSDKLDTSYISNSNAYWDGGSVHFSLNNNLNNNLATDYDITYDVECSIDGEAAEHLNCYLNGTTSNVYSGTLSAIQGCRNDKDDQIDVSSFNKTTCELNGYVWASQTANKDMYFDIEKKDSSYEITDVKVLIKATSQSPYKKILYGNFILNKVNSTEGEVKLNYINYPNSNKLVISNSFNDNKCLKLTWNSDYVLIGEEKSLFSSFKYDSNNYINEVDFNIEPKSEITYNFYNRLYGQNVEYNLINFNVTTQDNINCS